MILPHGSARYPGRHGDRGGGRRCCSLFSEKNMGFRELSRMKPVLKRFRNG